MGGPMMSVNEPPLPSTVPSLIRNSPTCVTRHTEGLRETSELM